MGFLARLFAEAPRQSGSYPPSGAYLASLFNWQETKAGVEVNEWTALNYSAVWAAVSVISRTLAMLSPMALYRPAGRGKRQITDHYAAKLAAAPNPDMDANIFHETLQAHVLTWGNGYAEIERDGGGRPVALWPITPNRVLPDRDDKGVYYRVTADPMSVAGGPPRIIDAEDMIVIPGLGFDGIAGYSVVRMARESLALGLAEERFGATYFGNGTRPSGFLTSDTVLKKEARENLREEFQRVHQGPDRAHRMAILSGGLKWQAVGLPPEDSQFLESRAFQIVEVARWFNVPPQLLRDLTRATFSNVEQQNLDFLTYTMLPWLIRWEQQYRRKLLLPDERDELFFQHHCKAMLRADMVARYNSYAVGRQWGWLSADDVREEENLNPLPNGEGETYMVPANMAPARTFLEPEEAEDADGQGGTGAAQGEPAAELLSVPDVRQSEDFDCGAAATRAVAQFFGVDDAESEAEFIADLGTTPADGTRPDRIIGYFNARGLVTTAAQNLTLDDLARFFRAGQPVICCIQRYGTDEEAAADEAGHYVVVTGIGLGQVFQQDPSAGPVMTAADDWLENWHDSDVLEDGEVVKWVRYGIAVGAELLAEEKPKPEEPNPKDETADGSSTKPGPATDTDAPPSPPDAAPEKDQQAAARRSAARAVLVDGLGRMARRLANAGRRASKAPKEFMKFLDGAAAAHGPAIHRALYPAIAGLSGAAGADADARTAGFCAGLVDEFRAGLLEVAGNATAANLRGAVADWCDRWELQRPHEWAETLMHETESTAHAN
jgi:HK97 family phage portal protein